MGKLQRPTTVQYKTKVEGGYLLWRRTKHGDRLQDSTVQWWEETKKEEDKARRPTTGQYRWTLARKGGQSTETDYRTVQRWEETEEGGQSTETDYRTV
ncbi:hypothetical protein Pmani_013575 [Petrolisthes manimaculis]|uniref:Uncharacterized protein n=1 Tax=Petrolisthes manimaculis TaxID=1843537 RepID=A0AAE1PVD9_9EUCA|nr:hypothetical protein Pmani_013575 [Petrolisthes manimaculis]